MWGINNGAEAQKLAQNNPFFALLNVQGRNNNDNGQPYFSSPFGEGEGANFSAEASLLAPQLNENQEEKRTEEQRQIDTQRDTAMNEIDRKMMEILSRIRTDPGQKKVAIENFDRAKEMYAARPSSDNYTNWSKPSMIVLELLSEENRLPIQYQQQFGDLLKEYQGIMSPEFDREARNNMKSAWQNTLGLQGIRLNAA